MRVAFISFHTSPLATLGGKDTGGMNVYVRDAACELGRRGIAADIFTRSQGNEALRIDPRLGANVRVIHVPAGPQASLPKHTLHQYVPEFAEWVCRFVAQPDEARAGPPYDIIHAHYWLSGLVAESLRQCWGVKFLMTFHTLAELKNQVAARDQDRESDLRLRSECHLCDVADRITANTHVEKTQLVRLYGARSSRIRVIPPGVDLARFRPIEQRYARKVIGIPTQTRLILFAGRIERLKGLDTLFQAVAVLRKRRADWDWRDVSVAVIGGDPSEAGQQANEEMARLHSLRSALGLDDVITFLGARDQDALQYYYAAAEVLVMPSQYESFGMVALEAMACGTPVIASDVGGLAYLVRHGQTGYRVPARDAEALAAKIVRLLTDEGLRRRMGQRAACWAEGFAWPRIADRIEEVYQSLVR